MSYSKINWVDGAVPALNATNLNRIENGIYNNSLDITQAAKNVETLSHSVIEIKENNTNIEKRIDDTNAAIEKTKNEVITKADKANTLAGYGITNAYNKSEIESKLAAKINNTNDSVHYANLASDVFASKIADGQLGAARATNVYTELTKKADKTEVENIKACLGYNDEDIAGLCVDYQNKTFKRLAGAYGKNAGADFDSFLMFGGRKRCNVADDGTINAYYGDANYKEDGTNGQVMVYQPAFYYKVVPLVYDKNTVSGIGYHLRKANYYVSSKPKTGFKLHPAFYDRNGNAVDYILMSAYEGSMYDVSAAEYVNDGTNTDTAIETDDLLCSVAGKKPISGKYKRLNKTNLETLAQNRGDGWHLETIKATSANQLLMIIEFGTMNTQAGIGQGVVSVADNSAYNCSSLTGSTGSLGNGTGSATGTINEIGGVETAYSTAGKVSVSYRGVENPWGNIWKHIQGINIWGDGTMGGGQLYVANDFTFNESKHDGNYEPAGFTLSNGSGYINAMGYSCEDYDWLLLPSEIGGTDTLPVGDYIYIKANLNGYRVARLGGVWANGINAGGSCWGLTDGVGSYGRNIGGRLVYIPAAKSAAAPNGSSSNFESGTGTLAPATNAYAGCKGSFVYAKSSNVVTVSVNITALLSDKNYVQMSGLPYAAKIESKLSSFAVYSTAGILRNIRLDGSWLYINSTDKFAEGEKINFIITYIIK